jgi:peroxiredoxin
LCFFAYALSACGEEPLEPGHSVHGEAFNEGPRRFAQLMAGMGSVHFPVTTKSREAQKFVNQGVSQLHGFWHFEAERSFRQAAYLDADCAMAYWGMAMANIENEKRAKGFMLKATERREKANPRERRWIDAWAAYFSAQKGDEKKKRTALIEAIEGLILEFPDDLEAKAFLLFHLWEGKRHDIPLNSRVAVDAIARQILDKDPQHPGAHHYVIHLWNDHDGDKHALASAERCGLSAPGIAHLWHMSGHTYSELKRYTEAAWHQEASARVDHGYLHRTRILPEQIHNYAHNNDWLVKNLAYLGRAREAIDLAKNLVELPRLGPDKQRAWEMGRSRLLETAVAFELWDELTSLESTMYLAEETDPVREDARLRALGTAWFAKGDATRGQAKLDALKKRLAEVREERIAAGEEVEAKAKKEKKGEGKIDVEVGKAVRKFSARVDSLKSACAELRLYRALSASDAGEVRKQIKLAKDLTLIRAAQVYLQLGDFAEAEKRARDALKADSGQCLPHAVLAETLWKANKRTEALEVFDELRKASGQLDLELPVFQRLTPLAQERQLDRDWRQPASTETEPWKTMDLAKLGPFRWHPYEAPAFSLLDRDGKSHSLSDYRGKPVLVAFYLGGGCRHCIEQLNALAPLTKSYAEAGIEIIAVSTEAPEDLQRTFDKAKDPAGFPFPIVSDHSLDRFRAYGAHDDFEKMALHGTFLVDASGLVRWQNISYEPFTKLEWLLAESKRLLNTPVRFPGASASAVTADDSPQVR